MLQIGQSVQPHNASSRLLFLVTALFAFLTFTYYTCDLTARMTSGPTPLQIRSFEDVLALGYRVIVLEDSSSLELLKNSEAGTAMHSVYYDTMDGDPASFTKSVKNAAVRRNLIGTGKVLLFGSSYYSARDPDLVALDVVEKTRTVHGITFGKGSEFTELFNHHIAHMDETGLLAKIFHVGLNIGIPGPVISHASGS